MLRPQTSPLGLKGSVANGVSRAIFRRPLGLRANIPEQIVFRRVGDFHVVEFADGEGFALVNEDVVIDIGRVEFRAADVAVGFFAVDEHLHRGADAGLVDLVGDFLLQLHDFVHPFVLLGGLNGVAEVKGGRVLLLRVGENAESLETVAAHELHEFLVLFAGLGRVAGYQRGAQRDARDGLADARDEVVDVGRAAAAPHALQDVVAHVLERNVQVAAVLRVLFHHLQNLVGEVQRVGVMQPNPLDAIHLRELVHQVGEFALAAAVDAVVGEVLGDQHQLLNPLVGKTLCLFHQQRDRFGDLLVADERDGAVGALVVAALGNLEVGVVPRGREHPVRCVEQLEIGGFQQLRQFREGEEAIHFGQGFLQFRHVALDEASHHVQLLDLAAFLAFNLVQNLVHGFFPRIVDEAACVDDHDVAFLCAFVVQLVSVAVELRGHNFRIHNVFGTA